MIPTLPYLLSGWVTVAVDAAHTAPLLELCRRHGLIYENFQNREGGGISLRIPRPTARRLEALCAAEDIPLTRKAEGGLPGLLLRLWHRPGLIVGAMLALGLMLLAQSVVWDIRITGNETVSDRAIEESLASCGFGVGTPLRGFEADKTENDVLLSDSRLAWISINRKGTVAYVEVREKLPRPSHEPDAPCDIVASMGGVIERVELEAGNVRVGAGQLVGKGEVLVSGLYDSLQVGIRWKAAKARVYARVTHVLTVQIPLSYEQKTYETGGTGEDGGQRREKSINFFGKSIKFSKKTGNYEGFCDTIEEEYTWGLKADVGFPISVRTVWYLPYTVTQATRTYAEAEELAYLELAAKIAALPGGAELLSKTVTVHRGEDFLTLVCTLNCIEDIGEVRPIEIAEESPET